MRPLLEKKPSSTSPFVFIDVDVSELDRHPDALNRICKREYDVLIVRNVFPPALMRSVVETMDGPDPRFERSFQQSPDPNEKQLTLFGIALSPYSGHPNGPDLDRYYEVSGRFRRRCRELFAAGPDFETRVEEVFRALGGGRSVAVPPAPGGRTFTSATIRSLPPGCEIQIHVGNYFREIGGYRDLASLLRLEDQLSYFVPLAAPERGGELVVYTLEYGDPLAPKRARRDDCGWGENDKGAKWPSVSFNPRVGDLLVFNGGRYYHRVATVQGALTRWTIGGFAAFSKDDRAIYYWS